MNRCLECISNYSLSRYLENIFNGVNLETSIMFQRPGYCKTAKPELRFNLLSFAISQLLEFVKEVW